MGSRHVVPRAGGLGPALQDDKDLWGHSISLDAVRPWSPGASGLCHPQPHGVAGRTRAGGVWNPLRASSASSDEMQTSLRSRFSFPVVSRMGKMSVD